MALGLGGKKNSPRRLKERFTKEERALDSDGEFRSLKSTLERNEGGMIDLRLLIPKEDGVADFDWDRSQEGDP